MVWFARRNGNRWSESNLLFRLGQSHLGDFYKQFYGAGWEAFFCFFASNCICLCWAFVNNSSNCALWASCWAVPQKWVLVSGNSQFLLHCSLLRSRSTWVAKYWKSVNFFFILNEKATPIQIIPWQRQRFSLFFTCFSESLHAHQCSQ